MSSALKNLAKLGVKKVEYSGPVGLKKILSKYAPNMTEEEEWKLMNVIKLMPFKTNNFIVENLIDWENYETCPMYRLTFPHPDMLHEEDYDLIRDKGDEGIKEIIQKWNPHEQLQIKNIPSYVDTHGETHVVKGVQHKYPQTALYFPDKGQYCFAYCEYCFRWAQFHDSNGMFKFEMDDPYHFYKYLETQPQVTDILITGGDPGNMKAKDFDKILRPLMDKDFAIEKYGAAFDLDHVQNIRIGTRALTYWPYRFIDDEDTTELLELFEEFNNSDKQLYVMCHFGHPKEITNEAIYAIDNLRNAGCQLRSQSPIARGINDDADLWAEKWRLECRAGVTPYYMFIPRATGPRDFFKLKLTDIIDIFGSAKAQMSGIGKTARGPSVTTLGGKLGFRGVDHINGEDVFVLKFFSGRNGDWCKPMFYAKYDPEATHFDELVPAFGEKEFFFEEELREWVEGTRNFQTPKFDRKY